MSTLAEQIAYLRTWPRSYLEVIRPQKEREARAARVTADRLALMVEAMGVILAERTGK